MMKILNVIPPKYRQIVLLGCGALALFVVISATSEEKQTRKPKQETEVTHVFTDRNTRELGIDSLTANLRTLRSQVEQKDREIDVMQRELVKLKSSAGLGINIASRLDNLTEQVSTQQQQLEDLKSDTDFLKQQNAQMAAAMNEMESNQSSVLMPTEERIVKDDVSHRSAGQGAAASPENGIDPSTFFRETSAASLPTEKPVEAYQRPNGQDGQATPTPAASSPSFVTYQNAVEETENEEEQKEKEADITNTLPTGSLLSGVFLSGGDFPTGSQARQDPVPALIKLTDLAILPNKFTMDIRECFVTVSGYGSFATERALLRSEQLSCVKTDGKVIDTGLKAAVIGSDGKAGIRGRLISKQGALLGRSMVAGFAEAFANAFNVTPVLGVNTNPGSTVDYQSVYSPSMVQGALSQGAGNALNKIAQFYVDMANETFPVIEIDAGRKVDLMITAGTNLG